MANQNQTSLVRRMAAAVNPRKTTTGTTLKSSTAAALTPPPKLDQEFGSSQPVRVIELVPELVSPYQRLLVYTKMMKDAGVDVSIRAAKMPVLGAEFFVEPYSEDPQDMLVAEFINANLFGGMSAPFLNSLEDILKMYQDGYSVLEKVYELREWTPKAKGANTKQFTMLKKLAVRPTSTITTIDYDNNGGPKTINHNAIQSDGSIKQVPLDIAKVVVFTFGKTGGDLTGKSLLRTAYSHWYYKTHFYKIDAIQKERHSLGVPKGKLMAGYAKQDLIALRTLLKNLRSNEESYMILPPNIDVEFAEVKGQLVDVLASAAHHNAMILLNVLAQFLALGLAESGSGGGRATAGAQTDMFMKSLKYVAQLIVDIINMYIVPELVVWNFPTRNFPQLRVRNIGDTRDLQMIGSALAGLFAQNAITNDNPTENWIRKLFDMPLTTQTPNPPPGNQGNQDNNVGGSNQQGATKNGKGTGNVGVPTTAPQ